MGFWWCVYHVLYFQYNIYTGGSSLFQTVVKNKFTLCTDESLLLIKCYSPHIGARLRTNYIAG